MSSNPFARRALVRDVPSTFAQALCARPPEVQIDLDLARSQHAAYVTALRTAGAEVTVLPADEGCPDCCFVEDTAVIVDGFAVVTMPGAPARRAETAAVEQALAQHLEVHRMELPATADGGDCLRLGSVLYVGLSARTNAAGAARLADVLSSRGIRVVPVELPPGMLHLKCVCSPLGSDRVLLAKGTLPMSTFAGANIVWVDEAETYAANAVYLEDRVILAAGFPKISEKLAREVSMIIEVPTSEVQKADGSLTCQSLLW